MGGWRSSPEPGAALVEDTLSSSPGEEPRSWSMTSVARSTAVAPGSSAADAVVDQISEAGGEAVANYDSVSTPDGGAAIVGSALENFGKVDIVINNAGILRDRSFANLSVEELRGVVDTHLIGAFYVSYACFPIDEGGQLRPLRLHLLQRRASLGTSGKPTTGQPRPGWWGCPTSSPSKEQRTESSRTSSLRWPGLV